MQHHFIRFTNYTHFSSNQNTQLCFLKIKPTSSILKWAWLLFLSTKICFDYSKCPINRNISLCLDYFSQYVDFEIQLWYKHIDIDSFSFLLLTPANPFYVGIPDSFDCGTPKTAIWGLCYEGMDFLSNKWPNTRIWGLWARYAYVFFLRNLEIIFQEIIIFTLLSELCSSTSQYLLLTVSCSGLF